MRLRFAFQSKRDLYLVTDYYAGGSLERSLKLNREGLGVAAARSIVAQLALGLDYLHARDVLHRDIKAANVLLDAQGHAHLCDFGLAKCVDNDRARADAAARAAGRPSTKRSFAGTVEYMAPELLESNTFTEKTDVYAFAILIWEVLSGEIPWAGINQMQPPQLEYSEAREIQRQALVRAAQDARARAKLLAETLGMTLGPLHRLQATETPPSPPMPKMMAMRADMGAESGNAELGLSTGELRFSASVQAEFDLLLP